MSEPSTRTLLLMRHAHAEGFAADDHSRRLSERGRSAAAVVGSWLGANAPSVDVAVVSSALRAQETYAALSAGGALLPAPRVEDAIYSAGEDSALHLLRAVPDLTPTAVLVGHNPTVSLLAQSLCDDDSDPSALVALAGGFPPGGVAVLVLSGAWSDLEVGTARLTAFFAPA